MTNYREVLRLNSLGLNKVEIAQSCGYLRNTVATLPFSGYSYVEAFFSMNQECWTSAHVNAYRYFGGVARIIQCDNLKTGVYRHGRNEVTLNRTYRELAEHYGTAVIPARVRTPKDKAMVEGTVGVISTFILAAIRNEQFLSLPDRIQGRAAGLQGLYGNSQAC